MVSFKRFVLLKEGGNAVKNVSRINAENIEGTLKSIKNKVLSKLKISSNDIRLLGSTGKKRSGESAGDIDIAVDVNSFIKKHKIKFANDVFPLMKKLLGKISNDVVSNGFDIVSFAYPIQNIDGKQKGKLVQVDLMMMNDLDFSEWIFWSPASNESNYKGVYRNILLSAILKEISFKEIESGLNKDGVKIPIKWERLFIDFKKGLMRGVQTQMGKKGLLKKHKTISSTLVSNNVDEIITMVFGPDFNKSVTNSLESVLFAINSLQFIHKKYKKKILKTFVNMVVAAGLLIPKELEKF